MFGSCVFSSAVFSSAFTHGHSKPKTSDRKISVFVMDIQFAIESGADFKTVSTTL